MVKDQNSQIQRKAMMAELKFLMLLGRHVNIVNLLGAVTKYPKGGVMIILEYCHHGNLRRFLQKHKQRFIPDAEVCSNNVEVGDLAPDEGDYSRKAEDLPEDGPNTSGFLNIAECVEQRAFPPETAEMNTQVTIDARTSQAHEESTTSKPESGASTRDASDASLEDHRRPKRRNKRSLFTRDLLCFAFQCARGMTYLASKKLIHRDLATRNILLAAGNVIKICDFRLSEDSYEYPNNNKSDNVLLPIQWMAIESLGDRVYSTKSDVWSFGIVLWELFTLGSDPYPGILADETFYERIKEGYRMEKPQFSPDNIYEIMQRCWKSDPAERPNFWKLSDILGSLLDSQVKELYINLNEPYARRNQQDALTPNSTNVEKRDCAHLENFTNCETTFTAEISGGTASLPMDVHECLEVRSDEGAIKSGDFELHTMKRTNPDHKII